MGAKIDLIGKKFSKLTVVQETKQRDSAGGIVWECQCECGNLTYASTNTLRTGHKRSCGCLNKEQVQSIGADNCVDIIGQRFGRLTVVSKSQERKDRKVCWNCICDCGSEVIATGKSLRSGVKQSCGCLKSSGEEKIGQILIQNEIKFEREKIFDDFKPYRYDFYVNNQYIIEYDGEQHFRDYTWGGEYHPLEKTQERDLMKNNYCHQHNIPIIRIPYTHLSNITIQDLELKTTTFLVKKE